MRVLRLATGVVDGDPLSVLLVENPIVSVFGRERVLWWVLVRAPMQAKGRRSRLKKKFFDLDKALACFEECVARVPQLAVVDDPAKLVMAAEAGK